MILAAEQVSYAYRKQEPVLQDVSLELGPGKILYLLGHNGSGKTTLLSCLSAVLTPTTGQVMLDGVNIGQISPRERARKIGHIPQLHVPSFAYTVREMVLMGRSPHLGLLGTPGREDYAITEEALAAVGLTNFAERAYTELSGGERQLVLIARGLAQQCDFLLMDEPDAHLDPSNQHRILEIVAELTQRGLSFIIASHAPNSALMFADSVVLLRKGRTLAQGGIHETLTESLLTEAYGMDTEVIYKSHNGKPAPRAIIPRRKSIPRNVEVVALKPESLGIAGSPLETIVQQRQQVVLVTGEDGSGKSSWCSDLVMQAQRLGWTVCGLLSPAVVRSGIKTGIDLLDLNTGQRRRLARLRDDTESNVTTNMWSFDMATLQWGNTVLDDLPPDCDLLLVDELGPLELKHGKGFVSAFNAIDQRCYRVAFVVVRSSLMVDALARWPDAYVVDVDDD